MERREDVGAPEGEEDEDEAAQGAEGEAASALGEFPTHQNQSQVDEPDQDGPDDFEVASISFGLAKVSEVKSAQCETEGKQNEAGQEQASDYGFEALDGRHEGKDGLHFMELQIAFLDEVHERSDRTQAKSAIGQGKECCVKANPYDGHVRARFWLHIKTGHQGENAY